MLGKKILLEADLSIGETIWVILGVLDTNKAMILVWSRILAFNLCLESWEPARGALVLTELALVISIKKIMIWGEEGHRGDQNGF